MTCIISKGETQATNSFKSLVSRNSMESCLGPSPSTFHSGQENNNKIINTLSVKNKNIVEKKISQNENEIHDNDIEFSNKLTNKKLKKKSKKKTLTIFKFFSYILALIISFIAIIIILDTFKHNLSDIFPNLEILLYNLFETVKDIYLFLKNLLY